MQKDQESAADVRAATVQWMADALDVGVVTVDRSLVITAWNHWLEIATGKGASEVLGRHILDIGLVLRPTAESAILRAVSGSTVVLSHALHGYFFDLPAAPGFDGIARMQQSVRVLPIPGQEGMAEGAVILIRDVTERVVREEDLRRSMVEAQQANRAKAEFLAAMSHELRTPIGAMSGYADLLADGIFGEVSDTQRSQLLRIKVVGAHLLSIVEEILSFARIEAGRETIHLTVVDVGTLVTEAVSAVEPLASRKGLDLQYHLPLEAYDMHTDGVKVRQILINLLGNAVKFTESGTISIDLDVSNPGSVAMAIIDTGPGIDEVDQARIFEPFVQVDGKLTRTHSGTGLGLSVSRVLARLLGGDLTVSSIKGAGSTFMLTLPRVITQEQ